MCNTWLDRPEAITKAPYIAPPPLWFPGAHEPIISLETYESAQKARSEWGKRTKTYSATFMGLLRCPYCEIDGVESNLESRTCKGKYVSYGCSAYTRYHRDLRMGRPSKVHPCPGFQITERQLLKLFRLYLDRFSKQGSSKRVAKIVKIVTAPNYLQQELDNIPKQRLRAQDLAVQGLMSADELRRTVTVSFEKVGKE